MVIECFGYPVISNNRQQSLLLIDTINIIFYNNEISISITFEEAWCRRRRRARKKVEYGKVGSRRAIKERVGEGRARAVLINFFPF